MSSGPPPPTEHPKWDYDEYPKTLARDDFWGQGRRTILGRPISEDEVVQLVDHIARQLDIRATDRVLDIGCGNGALSARLFDTCAGYVGVDASEYLVGVAREFFERPPLHVFFSGDAAEFAETVDEPERFTKCLCFAVLQYLPPDKVRRVLRALWDRFPHITRVVLGNLPDRERAGLFFHDGYDDGDLGQHQSQIGKWWAADEIAEVASAAGWKTNLSRQPEDVFNAKYRFDAILSRPVI